MIRQLAIVAVLVLAGCGPFEPFQPVGLCSAPGLAGIEMQDSRDCDCLRQQVAAAMDAVRPITGDTDFTGVTVWLRSDDGPWKGRDTWMVGDFVPPGDIEESRWGGSLAHELLHFYEIERQGVPEDQSAHHVGWDKRGWTAVGNRFYWSAQPGGKLFCW